MMSPKKTPKKQSFKYAPRNTRSVKGKATDLQSSCININIIYLTETHLDSKIPSESIITDSRNIVFRRD